jgi:hypothetical protein
MLLEKGHHMEASRRYKQHATRWQEPGPDEDIDAAVHEAFNRMRTEMGKQFFPAQLEAFQAYRAWEEAATGVEQTAAPSHILTAILTAARDLLVTWLSPVWLPPRVGEPMTAAGIPQQEHSFQLEDGYIQVWCSWRPQYHENPPHVRVEWRASVPLPGELWIFFLSPETQRVLNKFHLGTRRSGEEVFTSEALGFDPSSEKWAISLVLAEA